MEHIDTNPSRMVRVVKINPYLNNMAGFSWSIYFTSIIVLATTIFSSLLFLIYFLDSFDYLQALNEVETALMVIAQYFITNSLGVLNNFNYLNDFIGADVFKFNIALKSPHISIQGWILIAISGIIAFIFHCMSLYQYYAQKIIKSSGYFNYYIPYALLHKFWNRKKNKKLYIRILPLVKLEKINKNDFNMLIQNFFDIKISDIDNYEIKIESKRALWWFDYQILHLAVIEQKGKKNEKKEVSTNTTDKRQNSKVSINTNQPKKFFA